MRAQRYARGWGKRPDKRAVRGIGRGNVEHAIKERNAVNPLRGIDDVIQCQVLPGGAAAREEVLPGETRISAGIGCFLGKIILIPDTN